MTNEFKELDETVLKNFIDDLVKEYYEDYIFTEQRKKIFIEQLYDTALGTCQSLDEVGTLADGILIGWFMDRDQDYKILKCIFK